MRRSVSIATASLDLHVLAMPPAFNLSQDQTLQFDLSDLRPQLRKKVAWRPVINDESVDFIGSEPMPAAGAAEFLNILAPACLAAALGKVFGMTIHLDITEDVQFLPLWRERFSSTSELCESLKSWTHPRGDPTARLSKNTKLPMKTGSFSPTRMSGAGKSTRISQSVNPWGAFDKPSTKRAGTRVGVATCCPKKAYGERQLSPPRPVHAPARATHAVRSLLARSLRRSSAHHRR